jgi:hypothetical protein
MAAQPKTAALGCRYDFGKEIHQVLPKLFG